MAVMNQLGAKNDAAIFEQNEWWRIVTCNWLHAGLIHLLLNMLAVVNLGSQLERRFGFCRIAVLYVCFRLPALLPPLSLPTCARRTPPAPPQPLPASVPCVPFLAEGSGYG